MQYYCFDGPRQKLLGQSMSRSLTVALIFLGFTLSHIVCFIYQAFKPVNLEHFTSLHCCSVTRKTSSRLAIGDSPNFYFSFHFCFFRHFIWSQHFVTVSFIFASKIEFQVRSAQKFQLKFNSSVSIVIICTIDTVDRQIDRQRAL